MAQILNSLLQYSLGCHKELDTTGQNFHFQQNIVNLIKYLILRVSVCHKELLYLFIYFFVLSYSVFLVEMLFTVIEKAWGEQNER